MTIPADDADESSIDHCAAGMGTRDCLERPPAFGKSWRYHPIDVFIDLHVHTVVFT